MSEAVAEHQLDQRIKLIKDQVVVRYADGSLYQGELRAGRRHGFGTLKLPNGDFYEGSFEEGRKKGVGKEMTHRQIENGLDKAKP